MHADISCISKSSEGTDADLYAYCAFPSIQAVNNLLDYVNGELIACINITCMNIHRRTHARTHIHTL